MRLIDADKLTDGKGVFSHCVQMDFQIGPYILVDDLIKVIDGFTVSYDVVKVIEQLEERKKYLLKDFAISDKAEEVKERTMARINEIDGLIEIIKSGFYKEEENE